MLTNIDTALTHIDAPPVANRRHIRQVARRRFTRLEQRGNAIEHIGTLPGPRESLHMALDGRFAAWHLGEAIIELLAMPIAELWVCTLGFNRDNCNSLCTMLDARKVRSATLIVSDYFRSSDRTIFEDCRQELETRGQRIVITRSHAKLLLFDASPRQIVVETSANLRSSQNWEQATICDDAALLSFHRSWLRDLVEATK